MFSLEILIPSFFLLLPILSISRVRKGFCPEISLNKVKQGDDTLHEGCLTPYSYTRDVLKHPTGPQT